MKLFFYFFLISSITYCQEINYERFTIVDKKIIWQNVYQKDSVYNLFNLKKKSALNFNSDYIANVFNQKLNCKGLAIYADSSFGFNVLIEEKEDKYRITISSIYFDSNLQATVGYITAYKKIVTIEEAELRTSDFKFRKNNQSQTNLKCLDQFLLDFFKIENSKDW
jgi:hypothetical protein